MEALPAGREHTLPPRSLWKSPCRGHGLSPRRKGTRLARNVTWVADSWRGQLQSLLVLAPRYLKLSSKAHEGTTHFHSVNAMRGRQLASVSEIWARVMLLLDKSWISWGTHGDFTSDNVSINEHSLDPWMRKIWYRVPNQSTMITGQ